MSDHDIILTQRRPTASDLTLLKVD